MGSTGGRGASGQEKRTRKRGAVAGLHRRGPFLQECGLVLRNGLRLTPAMSRAVTRILVAGRDAAQRSPRMTDLGSGRDLAVTSVGQNQPRAMRAFDAHTSTARRGRPGQRRKQEPKEGGEFSQDGAPVGFPIVA